MTVSASEALALELHPVSPTRWVATFYPVVETGAGRWAEVTWVLHECLLPLTHGPRAAARWLEVCSPDPARPCYAGHRAWSVSLAAGYAQARALYATEVLEGPSSLQDPEQRADATVLVPAGQLSEWVLDDLQDEICDLRG